MAAKKESSGKATKKAKAGTRAKKASARKPAAKPKAKKAKLKASKKATSNTSGGNRASGLDKSVEHFRESLEHSVTLSRDRLQELVHVAVKPGRDAASNPHK